MSGWARRRLAVAIAVLLAAGLASTPGEARVYQWTDDDGAEHYSTDLERVPPAKRSGVRVIQTPTPTGEVAAAPPDVLAVTAGAPLLVEAHVNGIPLTLLVDTGASRTVLARSVLARAGVDLAGARPVRLIGVGGTADGHEITVPRLDIAGTTLGPLAVLAYDVPELEADGLLGRDVLGGFVLTIDPARGRATLGR